MPRWSCALWKVSKCALLKFEKRRQLDTLVINCTGLVSSTTIPIERLLLSHFLRDRRRWSRFLCLRKFELLETGWLWLICGIANALYTRPRIGKFRSWSRYEVSASKRALSAISKQRRSTNNHHHLSCHPYTVSLYTHPPQLSSSIAHSIILIFLIEMENSNSFPLFRLPRIVIEEVMSTMTPFEM